MYRTRTRTFRTSTMPGAVPTIQGTWCWAISVHKQVVLSRRWYPQVRVGDGSTHSTEKMHRQSWKVLILLLLRNRRCSVGRASSSVTWSALGVRRKRRGLALHACAHFVSASHITMQYATDNRKHLRSRKNYCSLTES